MKTQKYLESTKFSALIFAACFCAYSASYIGRLNFSGLLPAIIENGILTKSQGGVIGSAFFVVYGTFQIINGFLGDKISPFKMIVAGTFLSGVANLLFPFCTSYMIMAVVWGFNGFAASLLWASILKILANIINDSMRQKCCLQISITLPIGTVIAYLFSSLSVKFFTWKAGFILPCATLLFACGFFIFSWLKIKPHITERAVETFTVPEKGKKTQAKLFPVLILAGMLFVLPADAIHGAIKEGITTWLPTMITEVYSVSPAFSSILAIILPIFNLAGVYIITPIYKDVFKRNEIKTASAILLFTALPLGALIFMRDYPAVVSVALLGVTTTAMHAFNYMIITCVPMRFAKYDRTATVTGIMNATAYVGCAVASFGFGMLSDKIGWTNTVICWLILVVLALLFTNIATKKWSGFINERI